MKKFLSFLLLALCANFSFLHAQQLSAPNVENVYGGRINAITGFGKNADTSRIFIATESANSIFYADVANDITSSATTSFSSFTVMPGLSAAANFGSNINNICAHANSGYLFFAHSDKIFSSHPSSSMVNTVSSGGAHSVYIIGDYMFYIKQDGSTTYNFGTINASGVFAHDAGSPIAVSVSGMLSICVNPANNKAYIFVAGSFSSAPQLLKSSDDYTALSSATTFTDVSPSLSTTVEWRAFGIAPDGRLFVGGSDGFMKYSAYSDDEISWTSNSIGISGVSGTRYAFGGSDTAYYVYFSRAYNTNKGDSSAWMSYGMPGGFETHPNDGDVYVDPNDPNVVYMTTDQGIGASIDRGSSIFEINHGVEAVQVNDFDMTADKQTAWIASKAGIRKVSNYPGSKSWTPAMFPNGDGSPYYSAEMANDTNKVYVGNARVYKTTDGNSWSQVFTAEGAPYNYSGIDARVEAIEVCEYDPNIVFAGYYVDGSGKGGLFFSSDAGANWDILLLDATSGYNDVDVWDVIFNIEGADTVAYVGVEYDLAAPTGRSVYRIVKSGSTWTAAQDMDGATTSTGSIIVATIRDLHKSATGDTLFSCGTDAGTSHPVTYYKVVSGTNKWTPFSVSGFPSVNGKQGAAITLGADTVFCAVENEIYFSTVGGSSWTLGYAYPAGTQINFLYYDELLAGTGTGLYGHFGSGNVGRRTISENASQLSCYPNPFSNNALLKYTIPQAGFVSMKVFDVRGKEIATLVNEERTAGTYETNFNGRALPGGMYFIQLNANGKLATIKVMAGK